MRLSPNQFDCNFAAGLRRFVLRRRLAQELGGHGARHAPAPRQRLGVQRRDGRARRGQRLLDARGDIGDDPRRDRQLAVAEEFVQDRLGQLEVRRAEAHERREAQARQ